jgi:hypothetical protein
VLILADQRLDAVESRVEALVTIAGGLYESASVVTSMLESGGGPLGALLGLGKRK